MAKTYRKMNVKRVKLFSLLFVLLFYAVACKHDHKPSPELLEAFNIQKQGLELADEVKKEIDALHTPKLKTEERKLDHLMSNMVEIEGLAHDHSQCNGDHRPKEYAITDKQMIAVQQEWVDSLKSVKARVWKFRDYGSL